MKYRVWDFTDKKMLYFEGIFNKRPITINGDGCSHAHTVRTAERMCRSENELSDEMLTTYREDREKKLMYAGDLIMDGTGLVIQIHEDIYITRFDRYDTCTAIGRMEDGEIKKISSEWNTDDWISNPEFWKIIGNIYQHPELLEER